MIPGLPPLQWTGAAGEATYDDRTGTLTLRAAAGVDWTNDAADGPAQHAATALSFDLPVDDVLLAARVRVVGARTTFDAGALALWSDADHWSKLCNEFSPQGEAMVVSVVTDRYSDDANAAVLEAESVHLRVARTGPVVTFHRSDDGVRWDFVRTFRLSGSPSPWRIGFLAQAPNGETCVAEFDRIRLQRRTLVDTRNGS